MLRAQAQRHALTLMLVYSPGSDFFAPDTVLHSMNAPVMVPLSGETDPLEVCCTLPLHKHWCLMHRTLMMLVHSSHYLNCCTYCVCNCL